MTTVLPTSSRGPTAAFGGTGVTAGAEPLTTLVTGRSIFRVLVMSSRGRGLGAGGLVTSWLATVETPTTSTAAPRSALTPRSGFERAITICSAPSAAGPDPACRAAGPRPQPLALYRGTRRVL